MSKFDYTNPEKSLSDMQEAEEKRREEVRAKGRIPDDYDLDSRVKEVMRGTSKKGDPKWMFEVSLRDRAKPWDKARRTLHFSEGSDWLMGRFWEIVKAWGIDPAWLPATLWEMDEFKGLSDAEKQAPAVQARLREEAVLILMGFIEEAIEAGAELPLHTEHRPDNRDPKKIQVNFMERAGEIQQVLFEEAPAEESQEPPEEEAPPEEEPEPVKEEPEPVKEEPAEKPAGRKPRSPYGNRPKTAV